MGRTFRTRDYTDGLSNHVLLVSVLVKNTILWGDGSNPRVDGSTDIGKLQLRTLNRVFGLQGPSTMPFRWGADGRKLVGKTPILTSTWYSIGPPFQPPCSVLRRLVQNLFSGLWLFRNRTVLFSEPHGTDTNQPS